MTSPAPGWYPAPHAGGELRYFDGKGWLDIAPPPGMPPGASQQTHPAAAYGAQQQPVDMGASIVPRVKKSRAGWIFACVFIVLMGVIVAGVMVNANIQLRAEAEGRTDTGSSINEPAAEPAAPKPDFPAGFKALGGGTGLGFRFVDDTCSISTAQCSHMEVYSEDGCPNNLYVEVNVLDASSRVIGFTNDTVASLGPGQTALLEFTIFETGASNIQVADASCF